MQDFHIPTSRLFMLENPRTLHQNITYLVLRTMLNNWFSKQRKTFHWMDVTFQWIVYIHRFQQQSGF